ncbi:citrate (Si)-synthase [PVC group bacterium (ex Bugula neritina AB1)]|nr:citrate (Si)-synthase [PVC group bacterium (ex Bugula neritina AB1)]
MCKNKKVRVTIDSRDFDFPVIEGSEKEKGIDISSLRSETGYVTLDVGYANTGSTQSSITFLDGEKGVLRYRGYPIEQLAEKATFLEVAWLLFYGEMPTDSEIESFSQKVALGGDLHKDISNLFGGFAQDSHPMAIFSAGTMALSGYHPDFLKNGLSKEDKDRLFVCVMGQMATLAANIFRFKYGKAPINPDKSKSYEQNFLHMMFSEDDKEYRSSKSVLEALRVLLILHADHEQNCSTSAVRLIGSSLSNCFASLSGGIAALWGVLHGGANQKMIEMLEMIQNDGCGYKKYIEKAKDKKDPFRLMGFGHRVYRKLDPRANVIRAKCDALLEQLGKKDPLLDIAKELERTALEDEYFIERKLYPNVDFYSGIMYRAMGIPVEMFTVLFSLGRIPGWLAHWKEMVESSSFRISRPRQIYTGHTERNLF